MVAKKEYFEPGQWNGVCQSCGFKFKSSQLRKRWDGLIVCEKDFEHRHPQDFVRARVDKITVPWTSPPPEDIYTDVVYIFDYVSEGYVIPNYIINDDL